MPACSLAEGSHRWVGVEVRSEPRDGGEVSTPGGGRNLVLPHLLVSYLGPSPRLATSCPYWRAHRVV